LHWIKFCDQPATACHDFDVPLTVRHNFVEPMGFDMRVLWRDCGRK
jgi:hypothetical protein